MNWLFIPRPAEPLKIGQRLNVRGALMVVESYSHTGKNLVVTSLPGSKVFTRLLCVITDAQPIAGIPQN